MKKNIDYDKDVVRIDYRWATAAASGSAKGYTMWDSHLGMCEDFSNLYAIMCGPGLEDIVHREAVLFVSQPRFHRLVVGLELAIRELADAVAHVDGLPTS